MPRLTQLVVLTRRDLLARLAATSAAASLVACAPDGQSSPDDTGPFANSDVVIPPIVPNEEHYITSCCATPEVDGASWQMQLFDAVAEVPVALGTLTLAGLQALPGRQREHTLMCISAGPNNQRISNAIWTGLPLTEVFATYGVSVPEGTVAIRFDSADGYSTAIPVSDLALPVWLVWQLNGVDIPAEHGFPVRLLVPNRYGMKNPKWITSLTFLRETYLGFWETRGWSDSAEYRPNALIRYPRETDTLVEGPLTLVGTAYAGSDPVVKVEVSIDGTWVEATIDYQNGPDTWALWHFDWEATPGAHTLQARCTTESGRMSDVLPEPPFDGAGYGGSMEVGVEIA